MPVPSYRKASAAASRKELVLRPRQPEIFAQGCTFIFTPEDAPALQFRNYLVDEIIEPAGQIRERDVEPIGAFRFQPMLHFIGNGGRRSDESQPAIAAKPLGELFDRKIFARRKLDGAGPAGLAGIGFRDFRQRTIRIEFRGIDPKRDGERGDGAVIMHAGIKKQAGLAGLFRRIAHHHESRGQDFQVVAIAAELFHPAFDIGIEGLGSFQRA